jgi:hypothetical protein
MALAEVAGLDQIERWVRQVEQADQIRDRDPAAPEALAELFLRQPEILDQRGAGARLVDRVEVLAGDVLDQRRLDPARLVLVADQRRDDLETGLARSAPAALAGDQLVAAVRERPDDERLDHAGLGNRLGERRDRLGVEAAPRLVGVRPDQGDGDLAEVGLADTLDRQDRGKSPAHPPPLGAHAAASSNSVSRPISSSSSAR